MTNQQESNVSKQIWQSQSIDAPAVSLDFIRYQVRRIDEDRRRETQLLYGCLALFAVTAVMAWLKPVPPSSSEMVYVIRAGVILASVGFAYIVFKVRFLGGVGSITTTDSVPAGLDAYRAELTRRRDYYRDSWRWSLWPIAPSVLVFLVGGMLFDHTPGKWMRYGSMIALAALALAVGIVDHKRKAAAFQRELDALGTLHGGASDRSRC